MKLPLLDRFEEACAKADLRPTAVLRQAGVNPSTWWRWKSGTVSPTLRKFEAVIGKLEELGGDACECGGNCKPKKGRKA